MSKQKLVVIGNGMAGIRTLEELLKLEEADQFAITVFGDEPHPNYNRIMLSPVLAGEKRFDEIILNTPEWYAEHEITLHSGDPVVEIDRVGSKVISASGLEVDYDRLLGARKAGAAQEVVFYFARRQRIDDLATYCAEERPDIKLEGILKKES